METAGDTQSLSFTAALIWAALGVALSIAIPLLRKALPGGRGAGLDSTLQRLWRALKPYAATAVFSLATALLLVAFTQDTLDTWQAALLGGYAWDSTIQKITQRP